MKIKRLKKAQKILNFYSIKYGYREPYQILVDGTFCQAALQGKVAIEEQLQKYLQHKIKLLTTQCIILEIENLGSKLIGAMLIVKQFAVHKCGHEGKSTTGSNCIKSMIKDNRYIIATQDKSLQNHLRRTPGQALLYLHKSTPILETPTSLSKNQITTSNFYETKVKKLKEVEGIKLDQDKNKIGMKRKHIKIPNPLSCKKSKKIKKGQRQGNAPSTANTSDKPKRKRIKIPSHIKEHLKNIAS